MRTDKAPTPEGRIQGLAHDFLKAKGKEHDAPKTISDYEDLTAALRRENPGDVKDAINTLLEKRGADDLEKYYRQWQHHNFTGSYKDEADFLRTLNQEQRGQYAKAREERRRIGAAALKAISAIPASKRAGPFAVNH